MAPTCLYQQNEIEKGQSTPHCNDLLVYLFTVLLAMSAHCCPLLLLSQIGEEWTTNGHVNHGVGAHSVFCCPHCGLIADRDKQAAKSILGTGLSVLRELDPDLYKQRIHGTSLAVGAYGCCIPARA